MSRVALATLWLVALVMLAGMAFVVRELGASRNGRLEIPDVPAAFQEPSRAVLVRQVGQRQRSWGGWAVVDQLRAHHILVVQVEAERPEHALKVAYQLAEPVKSQYAEILVYFYRPGRRGALAARRVQWTPASGYAEIIYEQ